MGLLFKHPKESDSFMALNSVRDAIVELTSAVSEIKNITDAIRKQSALRNKDVQKNTEMLTDIYDALTNPDDKKLEPEPSKAPTGALGNWTEKNPWWGREKDMTSAAFQIHEELMSEGIDPDTDEYFKNIDVRMRKAFPDYFIKQELKEGTVDEGKPSRRTRRLRKIPLDINETRPLITIYEVAEWLGVNTSTVYANIHRGRFPIPYKKVGSKQSLWVKEDIEQWMSMPREKPSFTPGISKSGRKPKTPARATCETEGCTNVVALKEKRRGKPIYRKVCSSCYKKRGAAKKKLPPNLTEEVEEVGKPRFILLPDSENVLKMPDTPSKATMEQAAKWGASAATSGHTFEELVNQPVEDIVEEKKPRGKWPSADKKTPKDKDHLVFENYRAALSLHYGDLETGLFRVVASSWIQSQNNYAKFRTEAYRQLASQALDLFRDGKTLGQIRMMQPKEGGERPYLSIEGIMSRVVKAIFKLGTVAEIVMLTGEKK
jgi:excisionase family DNA binding protein